jgi:LysR family hydrogen peroxide-inducible transcriptional activator
MELHQLRYFVAAAEAGNFTQAAVRSHISQPSLSQQIIKLEGELGQKLFNRLGRRVQLTPAGQTFFDRARRILSEVDDATRAVRDESGAGNLRFGVIPTVAPYVLPTMMRKIRERLPDTHVEVVEDFGAKILAQVGEGDLDAVIVTLPPAWPNIEIELLYKEPLLAALPEKHPLAAKSQLMPRDMEGQSLVLLGDSSSLGLQTRRFFGDHRINVEVACRCAQVQTVKTLVAAGIGLAIVPEMAADVPHPGVVFRELSGVVPQREIVLVRNVQRFRGRAEETWLEIVREHFAKLRHGVAPQKSGRVTRTVRK